MSLIFLICAYVLTQNIIAFNFAKNKDINNQLQNYIHEISQQLETMSGTQSQLGKATYLYTKQAAQAVSTLENNYLESQEALYKNLASLSNAQNKATKLMIKYDQTNTTKVISTIKDLRTQLSDTMIQGFDQLQPDNSEVITALDNIVTYLKTVPQAPDQNIGMQLTSVANELQNISQQMQQFQVATPQQSTSIEETKNNTIVYEPTMDIPETSFAPEQTAVVENSMTVQTPAPTVNTPKAADDNRQLSADEIAALFAAAEPTPDKAPEPEADNDFTPTFTVVGKTDAYVEDEQTNTTSEEDPNKQLSADEIAALFAAADPAPKTEKAVSPAPTLQEDPNKQLSADEIAALFAASDPAPKKEEEPAIPNLSEDPNKQLSADEIAALFASLG